MKQEKMKMMTIINALSDISDPVALESIIEAVKMRKKKMEVVGKGGVKFVCPDCQGERLECCEDGPYASEVLDIDDEGDFEYGHIYASGMVDKYQCLECGYVLIGKRGIFEYPIIDNKEIIKWCKKNCEQK